MLRRALGFLLIACVSSVIGAQEATTAIVRRALLVGIEAYPEGPGWPALAGARADVQAFRTALIERAGFGAGDVHVLIDEQATRAAILGSFAQISAMSSADDLFLFYFAGHGSQLPDQETKEGELADELDDLDETLIPYDTTGNNGSPNDIRDDDLHQLVRDANEHTKNIVLVFDCCSSGTNVRGQLDEISRFVAPEARGLAGVRSSSNRRREPGSGYSVADDGLSYVSLSACRANESAFEYSLAGKDGSAGPTHGLFTYSLLQELYSTSQPTSYLDLMDRVRRRVRRERPQTPVIDGPLDNRLAFHGGLVVRPHAFRIDERGTDARLRGGLVNGIRRGAELDVFPDEASLGDLEQRLGTIRIDEVSATASVFRWVGKKPPSHAGSANWCAIPARPGSERTTVGYSIEGNESRAERLLRALENAPLLRRVEPHEAAYQLRNVRQDGIEVWQVFTSTGHALPLSAHHDESDAIHALAASLGRLGTLHSIRADLQNEASALLKIEASLERLDKKGRSAGPLGRDDAGILTTHAGDAIRAVLVNRSPVPIYATLIVMSPDGEIAIISRPRNEDDQIGPGKSVRTKKLTMRMIEASRPFYFDGVESFRWFVTTRYHDMRNLEQRAITDPSTLRGAAAETAKTLELERADVLLTRTIEVRMLPRE